MTAVVGAPLDVTVAEVAIESFYPADAETAAVLHAARQNVAISSGPVINPRVGVRAAR